MAGLRPADRDALTLHVLAGLTYAEVARALGIAPGTVASRISRATARLQVQITDSTLPPASLTEVPHV